MEAVLLGLAVATAIGLVVVLRRRRATEPESPPKPEPVKHSTGSRPRKSTSTMLTTLDDILAEDEGAE